MQQASNASPQQVKFEETQAEVLFQRDVFQMYDEFQDEAETTRELTNFHDEDHTHDKQIQLSEFDADQEKTANKPEVGSKALHGVYREGDDFVNDVCTRSDRELMRIFPSITEPEHTQILLDIYGRRKHLDGVAEKVHKIYELNHVLNEQERLGPCRDQDIINEKKNEIAKEEHHLWKQHKELVFKR